MQRVSSNQLYNNFYFKIEKGKKSKKGASSSADPEKSSIKRPAGTSAVNLTIF
jgi:hypothetical protein